MIRENNMKDAILREDVEKLQKQVQKLSTRMDDNEAADGTLWTKFSYT